MWLRGGFVSGAICCFVFCVWGVAQGGEEREEQLEIDCVSILKGFSPVRGCDRIFFPVSCCPLIRTHRALEARQKPKHGLAHSQLFVVVAEAANLPRDAVRFGGVPSQITDLRVEDVLCGVRVARAETDISVLRAESILLSIQTEKTLGGPYRPSINGG